MRPSRPAAVARAGTGRWLGSRGEHVFRGWERPGDGAALRPGTEDNGRCSSAYLAGGTSVTWLPPPLRAHLCPPPNALAAPVCLLAPRYLRSRRCRNFLPLPLLPPQNPEQRSSEKAVECTSHWSVIGRRSLWRPLVQSQKRDVLVGLRVGSTMKSLRAHLQIKVAWVTFTPAGCVTLRKSPHPSEPQLPCV